MLVLNQTLIFLILMLIGMYARKKGMLNKEVEAKISAVVVNIAYPAHLIGCHRHGPAYRHVGLPRSDFCRDPAARTDDCCSISSAASYGLQKGTARYCQSHGRLHEYRFHGCADDLGPVWFRHSHLYDRFLDSV